MADWHKTIQAALAEENSAWSMIWTMAEEAFERDPGYRNFTSGPVVEEIRLELEAAGVEMAFGTVKRRAIVGRHAHSAKAKDSQLMRSIPWSVVAAAAESGATPEATADAIRKGIKTFRAMREHFRSCARPGSGSSAASSKYSDDKLMSAIAEVAAHKAAEDRGDYQPGPMAGLGLSLLGQMLIGEIPAVDWDAQLAELNAAEG